MNIEEKANAYRKTWSKKGGYVVFSNGEAVGWKISADNPQGWEPQTILIGENETYEARGGNDYDGATNWVRVEASELNQN